MKVRYFSTKAAATRFADSLPAGCAYQIEGGSGGGYSVEWAAL